MSNDSKKKSQLSFGKKVIDYLTSFTIKATGNKPASLLLLHIDSKQKTEVEKNNYFKEAYIAYEKSTNNSFAYDEKKYKY